MKVFELAKKLNKKSKEILLAAEFLNIEVKSHLSTLNDEEIREIIRYFRKKRYIFFFKKYLTPLLLIFLVTILFFIIYPETVVSGEIDASVNEVGKLTINWEINESIEEGAILVESESELLIIEIDERIQLQLFHHSHLFLAIKYSDLPQNSTRQHFQYFHQFQ